MEVLDGQFHQKGPGQGIYSGYGLGGEKKTFCRGKRGKGAQEGARGGEGQVGKGRDGHLVLVLALTILKARREPELRLGQRTDVEVVLADEVAALKVGDLVSHGQEKHSLTVRLLSDPVLIRSKRN